MEPSNSFLKIESIYIIQVFFGRVFMDFRKELHCVKRDLKKTEKELEILRKNAFKWDFVDNSRFIGWGPNATWQVGTLFSLAYKEEEVEDLQFSYILALDDNEEGETNEATRVMLLLVRHGGVGLSATDIFTTNNIIGLLRTDTENDATVQVLYDRLHKWKGENMSDISMRHTREIGYTRFKKKWKLKTDETGNAPMKYSYLMYAVCNSNPTAQTTIRFNYAYNRKTAFIH